MSAIIYLITNTINGKQYVGQTRAGLNHRWQEHCHAAYRGSTQYICKAIFKYGKESFIQEVLEDLKDANDDYINQREIYWITEKETYTKGYNMTTGGGGKSGYNLSEETRNKIRSANLGKTYSSETIEKMSESAKNRTLEHREKISKAAKNRSEKTIEKMRISGKNKIFTETHRANLSAALSGSNNPNYGKKHSLETIEKIRAAKRNISQETREKMSAAAKLRCRMKRFHAPEITINIS